MALRVLLIDDAEEERRLAASVLSHELSDVEVIEIESANGFVERLHGGGFDVAVAAAETAWGDGASMLGALARRHPDCATILLGTGDAATLASSVAAAPIDAVLSKSSRGLARLPRTVVEVARKRRSGEGAAPEPADALALIAAVSHDLQDPLQIILHTARRLARESETEPAPPAAREIARLVGNAERMQEMLDGLTSGADAWTGAPQIESVALDEVLDEVVADLDARGRTEGATIERAPLPRVRADRLQIRRLLDNLVGNALKFRGEAPPRVSIQAVERADEWLISVTDNGIGIDPTQAERCFSMFVRLHGTHAYPGSGVGLAICRRIARAHGGECWVQPTPGGGSTFFVSLARRPPQAGAGEAGMR